MTRKSREEALAALESGESAAGDWRPPPVIGDIRIGSNEGRVRTGGGGSHSLLEVFARCRCWDVCRWMTTPGGVGGRGIVGGPSSRDGDEADRPLALWADAAC